MVEELKELQSEGLENPFVEKFEEFFKNPSVKKLIERLIGSYPDKKSLNIDFKELEQFDYQLADELLVNPDVVLQACQSAIKNIEVPALEIETFSPHVRFHNLPKDSTVLVREISAQHLNKLIAIEGIVRQFNQVQPKLKLAVWNCRRCGNSYKIEQDGFNLKMPNMCECKHRDFELDEEKSTFINHQKIGIQEPLEKLKGSEQATTLDVHAMDDLVNKVAPGDKTVVVGILRLYPPQKEKRLVYGRYVEALNVQEMEKEFEELEVSKEEEEEIKKTAKRRDVFEILRNSIAPSIYGHDTVKDAIALQLFNGVKKVLPGDMKVRGNIHILLVGDPGLAKSKLLEAVAQIAPKSIYTSGKTTSGVGLCVAPETLILNENGFKEIKEFVEEKFDERRQVEEIQGAFSNKLDSTTAPSIGSNFNIESKKIYKIWRIYAPEKMISIETTTGKNIKLTLKTSLVTLKNNEITWVESKDLSEGDFVLTTKYFGFNNAECKNLNESTILLQKNLQLCFEKIVKKTEFKPEFEFVYDFSVEENHNFIANGFFVHNTASAEKDEFGEGGWTLKAGALVLASGGMAMVDEFDKMESEDRSAMHEAMEQGTVSVAKAGIVTTFKTDTSVLAAANPKYSRFDPYLNPLEQVDLPPTLVSRFDLFFLMKDVLDRKKDEEIATFILKRHQEGEKAIHEKTFQKKVEEIQIEKREEETITADFLKKYISYARQHIFPIMTDNAMKSILEFYLSLRDIGRQEKVYAATHRQLEALVRLSEASARVRLKDFVEEDDTERAIRIFKASMQELAVDKETGRIDIDLITAGQASSKTSQIKKIIGLINDRTDNGKNQASIDEIIRASIDEGIEEARVKELILELKKKGELYEPAHGWIKPVERKD